MYLRERAYQILYWTQSYNSENGANTYDSFMQIAKDSCIEVFFKLLKIAQNLRAELTGQSDRCVPHESRHMYKQVSWLSAKRGMTYSMPV